MITSLLAGCIIWAALEGDSAVKSTGPIIALHAILGRALEKGEVVALADLEAQRGELDVFRSIGQILPGAVLSGSVVFQPELRQRVGDTNVLVRPSTYQGATVTVQSTLVNPAAIARSVAARRGAEATSLAVEEKKRAFSFQVAQQYVHLLRAQDEVGVREKRLTGALELERTTKKKYDAGLAREIEYLSAKSDRMGSASALMDARGIHAQHWHELMYLVAMSEPAVGWAKPFASQPIAEQPSKQGVILAAQSRSDVRAMRTRAREKSALVWAEGLAWLPTLDGHFALLLASEPDFIGKRTDWNGTLSLTWNLEDWAGIRSDMSEAQLVARGLDLELNALERRIRTDIVKGYRAQSDAAEALSTSEEQLVLAERVVSSAQSAFETGVDGITPLLFAKERYLGAFLAHVDRRWRYARNVFLLRQALGHWPIDGVSNER